MATFTGTVFSNTLNMNNSITLLTPKRFEGELSSLPVVYLLHGLSENGMTKPPLPLCVTYTRLLLSCRRQRAAFTQIWFMDWITSPI